MSSFRKAISLSLLLSLPFASVALQRTDLLPPNGQTYAQISNTSQFWSKLKASSIGRFWEDQQFQDFLGNPDQEIWNSIFFDGETSEEDTLFMEQMKMLTGEVVLAYDIESENIYIIADMSAEDFEHGLELDEQLRNVVDDPFDVVRSTFQDVEIIQHIEQSGTDQERSSWQTHVGRTFVLGYTREWIEQCIIRLKKEAITEPTGNPKLNLNLPIQSIFQTSFEDDDSDQAMFEALGLLDIENFNCRVELFDSEMIIDNHLAISDMELGLFCLFDFQPSELPTVTFIPENISSLEVGRFDLLSLWQEIPTILSASDPQAKPQFDMILSMVQQQTGINFEQDLLAHLDTQYLAFSTVEDNKQSSVLALQLEDGMAFKQGLESALTAPAMQPYVASGLEISDFLDYTIYTLKNRDPNETDGVAVTDDYLLYGSPEGLRQVIRSITSEAAENTTFEHSELVKGLRNQITPDAFGFGAIDWKKNMDAIISEFTKPAYLSYFEEKWAMSGAALPPPDFNKLPNADHIAEFFNTSYQYVEANGNGLHQKIILKY